jgi:hypothetical protein
LNHDTERPSFLRPCNAWNCPQYRGCLRHQRSATSGMQEHATPKGCPMFVDVRGVAIVRALHAAGMR